VENLKTQTNNSPEEAEEIDRINETLSQLPEVQAGKDIWQNDFHEYDLLTHTIQFVKHLKEISIEDDAQIDPDMIAAGWRHDIGKPVTAKPKTKNGVAQEREPGKPYHDFVDHDIMGAAMVREMDPKMFTSLRLSQERIAQLVASHYLPMKGIKTQEKQTVERASCKSLPRWIRLWIKIIVPKKQLLQKKKYYKCSWPINWHRAIRKNTA